MVKKRGRPSKGGRSRDNGFYIRFNEDETEQLNYISLKQEKTKSEIIRKALKIYYNLEKSKE